MAKILICPIKGIEKKAINKPGSKNHGHFYYLVTFIVGALQYAKVKRTTVQMTGIPEIDAEITADWDGRIATKQFGTIQGSMFTVGDKSLDPNTIELPAFRTKDESGAIRPEIHRTISVFCEYDSVMEQYVTPPSRKALQIIENTDLCEIVKISNEPGSTSEGAPY